MAEENSKDQQQNPVKKSPKQKKKQQAMSRNLKDKLIRKERTRKGLCSNCGKPLDREGKMCTACKEKVYQTYKARTEWYTSHGICPICGQNEIFPNEKICPECKAKRQTREENRKDYQKKYQKALRKKRKALGLCTQCGRPMDNDTTVCNACKEKNKQRVKKKPKQYVKENWVSDRKCAICGGEPLVEGKRVCEKCYSRLLASSEKREQEYADGTKKRKVSEYWKRTNGTLIVYARKRSRPSNN